MFRKYICCLLAVGVVFLTAGEGKGEEQTGTLHVIPMWGDRTVSGGTVSLCRIGSEAETGIQVTDGLATWIMADTDVLSEEWQQWVLQHSGGEAQKAVEDAGAIFTGLEEGVYLVRQGEANAFFSGFPPFLVSVPAGEDWILVQRPQVVGMAEAPRTGDHPAPIIGAMGIGLSVAALMVLVDGRKK